LLTCNLGSPNEQPTARKKRVRLWRTSDFKEVSGFGEHETGISSACFSPNGRYVAFASNQDSSRVFTRTELPQKVGLQGLFSTLETSEVTDVHLHDLSLTTPGLRIWNAVTGREEPAVMFSKGRGEGIAFSQDGRSLASAGTTIAIWDFENRRLIAELDQGPRAYSICLAFSPRSNMLATGGGYQNEPGSPFEDCGIKLWDVQSGQLISFLPHEHQFILCVSWLMEKRLWLEVNQASFGCGTFRQMSLEDILEAPARAE
jgi:WD40 repeat protein